MDINAEPAAPTGVDMTEWNDFPKKRQAIFDNVKKSVADAFPQSMNGVRLELHNLDYDKPRRFSLAEQKEALMSDKYLHHKLRGTLRLIDEQTGNVLDEQHQTLMRVPYLTERGTFIHAGNEYSMICLHGSSTIWTEHGQMTIKEIVQKRLPVKVWSYDFKQQKFVLKPVVNWFKNKRQSVLRKLVLNTGGLTPSLTRGNKGFQTLWLTGNHRVTQRDGSKCTVDMAGSLVLPQEVLSETQRQLIIGTMLGDGHITKEGIYRVGHCGAQSEYVQLKYDILSPLVKNPIKHTFSKLNGKLHPSCGFFTIFTRELAELRRTIYPHGVRNLDTAWYEHGDARALAFWFADDGSARWQGSTNSPVVTLSTNNFTPEDVEKLKLWLKNRWGLNFFINKCHATTSCANKSINRVLVSDSESAWRLFELVAPFLPECFRYKLLTKPHEAACRHCGRPVNPGRRDCNACLLQEINSTKGALSKSTRLRFGAAKDARALAASGVAPQEPLISDRWQKIQATLGTRVNELRADNNLTKVLLAAPKQFGSVEKQAYATPAFVYDIEVADTHNYVANGVLVSNCQARLQPGIYTRRKSNGELEAHCFHTNTGVLTEHGVVPIGKIVKERLAVNVWSYDFATSQFVLRPVTNWFYNKINRKTNPEKLGLARFDAPGRLPSMLGRHHPISLWSTPSHKVLKLDGTKINLSDAEYLTTVEESPTDSQCQLLYGSLLGDGHLTAEGLYQEAHGLKQEAYLRFKEQVLKPFVTGPLVLKANSGKPDSCWYLSSKTCSFFRRLRDQFYPTGEKSVPESVLTALDARGLAFWFCDDGSSKRTKNQFGVSNHLVVTLATQGFATADTNRLINYLQQRWGLTAKKKRQSRYDDKDFGWYLELDGESAEKFCDIVAPFVHPSLAYKLSTRPIMSACGHCGKEIDRSRKACFGCMLKHYELRDTGWRDRDNTQKCFGGKQAVLHAIKTGIVPHDSEQAHRWDLRMAVLGTGLAAMLDDTKPILQLAQIPFTYEQNKGRVFERSELAYDIEVEGTHNYIANGILVSNCNAKRGSGHSFRVRLEPESGLFKMDVGQSSLRLYSLLKDIGVPDEQLEKSWGPDLLESNRQAYDSRVFDKAYARLVRRPDPAATREQKAQAIKDALGATFVDRDTTRKTLPALVQ